MGKKEIIIAVLTKLSPYRSDAEAFLLCVSCLPDNSIYLDNMMVALNQYLGKQKAKFAKRMHDHSLKALNVLKSEETEKKDTEEADALLSQLTNDQ